ncbi:hypothetical protein V6N13_097590 [Hibiscus sabdariffa]
MNIEMGLRLGGCVGKALGIYHQVEGGNMGNFLRVRVQMDIAKPLCRCVLLGNGQVKQPSPCPLRYERFSHFCFLCGLVGHELSSCIAKPIGLDLVLLSLAQKVTPALNDAAIVFVIEPTTVTATVEATNCTQQSTLAANEGTQDNMVSVLTVIFGVYAAEGSS